MKTLGMLAVMLTWGSAAIAQNAAPPEDINPGVDTSAPSQSPASSPAARETPRPQDLGPAVDTPSPAQSPASKPATGAATPPSPANQAAKPAAQAGPRGKALDRLELDATQITGNRELPKVLYIVPWKRSDLGDLVGKPVNSLLDEVLAPVDRDVFQRENRYYRALTPGADEGASTGPDPKGLPQRAKPTNPLPAAGSAGSAEAAAKQRSPAGNAAPSSGNEK